MPLYNDIQKLHDMPLLIGNYILLMFYLSVTLTLDFSHDEGQAGRRPNAIFLTGPEKI